jgi:hypothetical protein
MALSLGSGVGWEPDTTRSSLAISASQPTGLLLSSSGREQRQLPGAPRQLPGATRQLPGATRQLPGPGGR